MVNPNKYAMIADSDWMKNERVWGVHSLFLLREMQTCPNWIE